MLEITLPGLDTPSRAGGGEEAGGGGRINFVLAYAIKTEYYLRHDEPLGSNTEFAYFLYLIFSF